MTDKHNFMFRVRVQGLKGQLQSSPSKSFLSKSISSMLWSKQFLSLLIFKLRGYFTFLTRSTSSGGWLLNVARFFTESFLRHSVRSTQLWCVAHVYKDKKIKICFSIYFAVLLPLHVARHELRCPLLSHDLQKMFLSRFSTFLKVRWRAVIHVNWDLDSEKNVWGQVLENKRTIHRPFFFVIFVNEKLYNLKSI